MRGLEFAVARVTIETTAPFAIGSGHHDDLQDSPFVCDAGGKPCIPATALAGILRGAIARGAGESRARELFGYAHGTRGRSSRVETSVGLIHNQDDQPVAFDEFSSTDSDPVLGALCAGIVRDHVALDLRGVAADRRKYDRTMVPTGARFSFELVVHQGEATEDCCLHELVDLLAQLHSPATRMGGRTRAGLGAFVVADGGRRARARRFNLQDPADREAFAAYRSTGGPVHDTRCLSLLHPLPGGRLEPAGATARQAGLNVTLVTDDLLLVGGGESIQGHDLHVKTVTRKERARAADGSYGEVVERKEVRELNRIPYSESRVVWTDQNASDRPWGRRGSARLERVFVVPATAIKGALRHRTVFHLGRIQRTDDLSNDQSWAEDLRPETSADLVPASGVALGVASLFGYAKGGVDGPSDDTMEQAGRVFLSDIVLPRDAVEEKKVDHVSLDRFTGGARSRRLFSEVVFEPGLRLPLSISVDLSTRENANVDAQTWAAFVQSVDDLCCGLLPIGAASSRGHGTAIGTPDSQDWSTFRNAVSGVDS